MKKFILSGLVCFSLSGLTLAQNYLVAKRNGSEYELVVSKKNIASVFDTQIGPYLDPASGQKFRFEDMLIDDPDPANSGSHAYLEIVAVSSRETVTVGLTLIKEVENEQVTRLYVTNLNASGSVNAEKAAAEAGWKCTSQRMECGGCKRVRDNGLVIGCSCLSGEGFCNFETTGGGGGNWPGWLTSLLLALLRSI